MEPTASAKCPSRTCIQCIVYGCNFSYTHLRGIKNVSAVTFSWNSELHGSSDSNLLDYINNMYMYEEIFALANLCFAGVGGGGGERLVRNKNSAARPYPTRGNIPECHRTVYCIVMYMLVCNARRFSLLQICALRGGGDSEREREIGSVHRSLVALPGPMQPEAIRLNTNLKQLLPIM